VRDLDAWRRAGRAFGSLGAGLKLATFQDQSVLLSGRGVLYFPTQGFGAALQLGYRVGF
jgi:hypothetical protein